jgi:BlaI family penicillinase repressor
MRVSDAAPPNLSRREREIMDVIFRVGRASASEICDQLEDPPTATAVRTLLRILEAKGHLESSEVGRRRVYAPSIPRERAQRVAIRHMLRTFFSGSPAAAVAALLDESDRRLSADERRELMRRISDAEQEGL